MVTIGLAIYIISAIGAILYIRYATENDEWGNFVINGERFYSGKYVIMNVPEEIRSKHIRNANCSGGWGTII